MCYVARYCMILLFLGLSYVTNTAKNKTPEQIRSILQKKWEVGLECLER
jgi:ribulose bisphosphate carboxylase small subunit